MKETDELISRITAILDAAYLDEWTPDQLKTVLRKELDGQMPPPLVAQPRTARRAPTVQQPPVTQEPPAWLDQEEEVAPAVHKVQVTRRPYAFKRKTA